MLKKLKAKLKKANNRGSSFVLVIVATSFMCILVSALLMGMLLAYKLRYYKLNSLNNFYSVEKAMDEIYAGVGASANEHLYSAYTTTAELVVYYKDGAYTNLDEDEANSLFKKLFIQGFYSDTNYKDMPSLVTTLEGFITDSDVELCCDNLRIVYTDENDQEYVIRYKNVNGTVTGTADPVGSFDSSNIKQITFKNICVKRTITLDGTTTNGASTKSDGYMASGEYVQSITTDLVLTEPEYNVSFDMTSSSNSSLYSYALLADMGLEVNGDASTTNVSIKGNVYTASDYYNKDYNADDSTKVTKIYAGELTTRWGSTDESAYSGIFVSGDNATLSLNSDVVVCAGSLAAFNGASITLAGRTSTTAELWSDNIIIGGTEGGSITAAANAYVFDDTELNAESSKLIFTQGSYFGYSFSANDIRSIAFLSGEVGDGRKLLATNYTLKSHFSDSSIIVNGEDSTLNLSNIGSIYIAGKSYIEFSRIAASSVTDDDEKKELGLTSGEEDYAYTTLLDYSTGQSLDVKSNQLIFLANWQVDDTLSESELETLPDGYTYVKLKFPYSSNTVLDGLYKDLCELNDDDSLVAIKQEVSGHTYYYLYIDDEENSSGQSKAEQFVEKYYDVLAGYSEEVTSSIYNVINYEEFTVNLLLPSDTSTYYTSGAVTKQNGDNSLYVQASSGALTSKLDVEARLLSLSSSKTFSNLLGNAGTTENNLVYEGLKSDSAKLSGSSSLTTEEQISNFLNYMYINLKDHLTVVNATDDDDNEISAYELAAYTYDSSSGNYTYTTDDDGNASYNYSITPLNSFVDYNYIFTNHTDINDSVYVGDTEVMIRVYEGDVSLGVKTDSSGDIVASRTGIIICGGDVTFDDSITSFTGLIIAGGKIICNSSISITADASLTASALQKCADSGDTDLVKVTTKIVKDFVSTTSENSSEVTGSSISDISYSDILCFQDWKKNVE